MARSIPVGCGNFSSADKSGSGRVSDESNWLLMTPNRSHTSISHKAQEGKGWASDTAYIPSSVYACAMNERKNTASHKLGASYEG